LGSRSSDPGLLDGLQPRASGAIEDGSLRLIKANVTVIDVREEQCGQ
jgi:hypothetical protein